MNGEGKKVPKKEEEKNQLRTKVQLPGFPTDHLDFTSSAGKGASGGKSGKSTPTGGNKPPKSSGGARPKTESKPNGASACGNNVEYLPSLDDIDGKKNILIHLGVSRGHYISIGGTITLTSCNMADPIWRHACCHK